MQGRNWYNLTPEEVYRQTDSSPLGLSQETARRLLEVYGPNELEETRGASPLRILLAQFLSPLVMVLIVAAVIAALLEELLDAIVILVIVVFNAVFGFVQEYRAEKAIQALKALAAPQAHVLRDGGVETIPTQELVVGDVVLLEAGSKVPADLTCAWWKRLVSRSTRLP